VSKENAAKYRQAQELLRKGWCRNGRGAVDSSDNEVAPFSPSAVAWCLPAAEVAVGMKFGLDRFKEHTECLSYWNDHEAADVEEVCSFVELAALVEEDEALS